MDKQEQIWEKRWDGSETKERLSILGRKMFAAKAKALRQMIRKYQFAQVLEVGCGLGHTLTVYKECGLEAFGIDISPTAVAVCRNKGLEVSQKSLEEVDKTYEVVSSDGMLEHFLCFEPLVGHMVETSEKYILLIQPNHDSFMGKTLAYLSELIKGERNVFEYNYRMKDYVSVFKHFGAELIESHPVFMDVFRLLLFEKKAGSL